MGESSTTNVAFKTKQGNGTGRGFLPSVFVSSPEWKKFFILAFPVSRDRR